MWGEAGGDQPGHEPQDGGWCGGKQGGISQGTSLKRFEQREEEVQLPSPCLPLLLTPGRSNVTPWTSSAAGWPMSSSQRRLGEDERARGHIGVGDWGDITCGGGGAKVRGYTGGKRQLRNLRVFHRQMDALGIRKLGQTAHIQQLCLSAPVRPPSAEGGDSCSPDPLFLPRHPPSHCRLGPRGWTLAAAAWSLPSTCPPPPHLAGWGRGAGLWQLRPGRCLRPATQRGGIHAGSGREGGGGEGNGGGKRRVGYLSVHAPPHLPPPPVPGSSQAAGGRVPAHARGGEPGAGAEDGGPEEVSVWVSGSWGGDNGWAVECNRGAGAGHGCQSGGWRA